MAHPELECEYTFTWDAGVQLSHLVWEDQGWLLLVSVYEGHVQRIYKEDLRSKEDSDV